MSIVYVTFERNMQSEIPDLDLIEPRSTDDAAKTSSYDPLGSGVDLPEHSPSPSISSGGLGYTNPLLMDLPVVMKVVLGSAKMALASVAKLGKDSIIRLDKTVGDPVEIFVNGRLIAMGDVVVLDQEANRFGVVLKEIVGSVSAGRRSR